MPQKLKEFTKTSRATTQKAAGNGRPDEAQLELISEYTVTPHSEKELYVRTFNLAHNAIDRDREVIDDALLDELAETLVGKGFFIVHPGGWNGDNAPGEGRIFEVIVNQMSLDDARKELKEPKLQFPDGTTQARILQASFYMVHTQSNKDLLKKIDAGIAGDVSIGFSSSKYTEVLDSENNIIAHRLSAPGEAYEASLVWLGAQPGARVIKNAQKGKTSPDEAEPNEEHVMSLTTEQIKALEDKKAAYKTQVATLTAKMTVMAAAILVATGIDTNSDDQFKALDAKATEIKQMAADGKAYRDDLIDKAVSAKRVLKEVGDTDDDVKQAKAFYASMPLAMLKTECEGLQKRAPGQQQQLEGSDPNTDNADDDDKNKGLRDKSVTDKALKTKAA